MEETKVLVYLLCLLAIIGVRGDLGNNATEIDEMREKLLQHEKVLEKELLNSKLNVLGLLGLDDQKYIQLIQNFKTFGDELEATFPSSGYEYLNALSSFRLWARIEDELKGIDGLYNVFRQMQREISGKHVYFDLQKLADFAETVLHDPKASIVGMLVRVTEFIVRDKLFVSAYQVQQRNFKSLMPERHSCAIGWKSQ